MQGNNADAVAFLMAYAVIIGFAVVISLAIQAVVCWIVSTCYKRIPQQFRKMEPNMVWLLMIPCVNIVWNFFVYPKLSQSYKAYFDSVGRTDVGDCAATLSMAYPIATACCIIPCVNYLAGPAALVLLIIVLVKAWGYREQIPVDAGSRPPTGGPSAGTPPAAGAPPAA